MSSYGQIIYEDTWKIIEEKDKEIERLNNIINELEKILIIEISEAGFHYEKIKEDTLQWIFNELQELKGSDKDV